MFPAHDAGLLSEISDPSWTLCHVERAPSKSEVTLVAAVFSTMAIFHSFGMFVERAISNSSPGAAAASGSTVNMDCAVEQKVAMVFSVELMAILVV
jgi:hypothetical protein